MKVTEVIKEGDKVTGLKTDEGITYDFDVVVDCTGPWSKFTGDMVGLDVPIWHTKAEAFFLCPPGKKLSYTFPVLKYPEFYALRAGDNIFICKSHLSMDLNNPMHAGQWDPDKLPATGGTDGLPSDPGRDPGRRILPGNRIRRKRRYRSSCIQQRPCETDHARRVYSTSGGLGI